MATKRKSSSGSGRKRASGSRTRAKRRSSEGPSRSASGSRSQHSSRTTTDHNEIRHWAEVRGAKPACARGTGNKQDTAIIRLEFRGVPNAKDKSLQEISWQEFFEKFDGNGLTFLYQETTANGQKSNFNKLVHAGGGSSSSRAAGKNAGSRSRGSSKTERAASGAESGDLEDYDEMEDQGGKEEQDEIV